MKTRFVIEVNFLTVFVTIAVILGILSLTSASLAQGPQPEDGTGQAAEAEPDPNLPVKAAPTVEDPLEMAMATTQNLHLSGSGFVQMYSDMDYAYSNGGCVYYMAGTVGHGYMNIPVVLPSNATITGLRFYYYDASAATDSRLRLMQQDDGNSWTELAVVNSNGSAGLGIRSVSGLSLPLDYVNYSYVVQYNANLVGSTMRLCGARITYTTPGLFGVALPAVQK